eukprot:7226548-Pyramimonas_sp.AAC.1
MQVPNLASRRPKGRQGVPREAPRVFPQGTREAKAIDFPFEFSTCRASDAPRGPPTSQEAPYGSH